MLARSLLSGSGGGQPLCWCEGFVDRPFQRIELRKLGDQRGIGLFEFVDALFERVAGFVDSLDALESALQLDLVFAYPCLERGHDGAQPLLDVADPEAKRKIIGRLFIEVFDEEAHKLEGVEFLAQGTIYPDVIESAGSKTGKAHVIKSHHNVGGLPETMKLRLVEPLRELFKDEVRRIGVELGLPAEMVHRHPFPGPGLGVRILGEVTRAAADTLRLADHIFIEELRRAGWYEKTSQAFAVFLPVKSVGVTGDGRRHEPVIALRAVETVDFMTAHWAHLPYELLDVCSRRIVNEVKDISRVVYDISGKPPATIEWE